MVTTVQGVLDIRARATRPAHERIRSLPHDAAVRCSPVRRTRYDRTEMIAGTPKGKERMTTLRGVLKK